MMAKPKNLKFEDPPPMELYVPDWDEKNKHDLQQMLADAQEQDDT